MIHEFSKTFPFYQPSQSNPNPNPNPMPNPVQNQPVNNYQNNHWQQPHQPTNFNPPPVQPQIQPQFNDNHQFLAEVNKISDNLQTDYNEQIDLMNSYIDYFNELDRKLALATIYGVSSLNKIRTK